MKKFLSVYLFSLVLSVVLSFASFSASAQGCVMCRSSVGEHKDKEQSTKVGASLNTGILYLMTIPYILVGTVGFIWYRYSRKAA